MAMLEICDICSSVVKGFYDSPIAIIFQKPYDKQDLVVRRGADDAVEFLKEQRVKFEVCSKCYREVLSSIYKKIRDSEKEVNQLKRLFK